jgi:hypothetical protein
VVGGGRVRQHRFHVLPRAPLGVVGDAGAVQAAVEVGRDEAGHPGDDLRRRLRQEVEEPLLVLGRDGEDVDQRDEIVAWLDRGQDILRSTKRYHQHPDDIDNISGT